MVFCVFIFTFSFRLNGNKGQLDERDFRLYYGNFFWKYLSERYLVAAIFKLLSTITRHIGNSILKDTLLLKILWTWVYVHANSFIKTSVNIMKGKSTKKPGKLSVAQKSKPVIWRSLQYHFYMLRFLPNKPRFWI